MYQIVQSGRIECLASVSREGLTREILARHSCLHLYWLFAFQSCVRHMLHFEGCLVPSYPWELFWLQFLESSHTLSLQHTTLTIKSHNKYRVQKIEYNYNEIWHGIKANKIHICKSQLYSFLKLHFFLHFLTLFKNFQGTSII